MIRTVSERSPSFAKSWRSRGSRTIRTATPRRPAAFRASITWRSVAAGIGTSVGREVDRTFRAGNQLGVDRVEPLLGREVNLVGVECAGRREDAEHRDETKDSRIHLRSKDPDFRHQSRYATTRQCGRVPRRSWERHFLPCAPIAACFVRSWNLLKRHAAAIRERCGGPMHSTRGSEQPLPAGPALMAPNASHYGNCFFGTFSLRRLGVERGAANAATHEREAQGTGLSQREETENRTRRKK